MVPVSIRTGDETEKWTNRVSAIFAALPTDEADPVKRVTRVHDAMGDAKRLFDAVPADALTDFASFPPPAVFAQAMRTAHAPQRTLRHPREPRDLQRARAAGAALHGRSPVAALLPGVDDRRRPGLEHHGAELPRTRSTSASSAAVSSSPTSGTCSTTSSTTSWRSGRWPASTSFCPVTDEHE